MGTSKENLLDNGYDRILKTTDLEYEPDGGIGYEFFRSMKFYENNTAQYIVDSNEEDTYGSLLKRCIRTAVKLKSDGVTQDDIICLCTYNHSNSCVPFIASAFLGVKVASLDPTLSVADTTHLLKQVKPTIIFLVPKSIDLIEKSVELAEIDPKLVIFGGSDQHQHQEFSEYIKSEDEEDNFQPVNVDSRETAVIFFSSGTTGLAKGICQSSYALLSQAVNMKNGGYLNGPMLFYSSLYWITSVLFLTASVMSGMARVICETFDARKIWTFLDKYKISFIFLAPTYAIEMGKAGRPEEIDTTSLQVLLTGGGIFPKKQLEILRDLLPGTFVCQAYGQTEVAGVLTIFRMNDAKDALLLYHKSSSCGRPIRGIWYKVVDPETDYLLGVNQQGELRVKSEYAMLGYYNLDASSTYDSEGWLRTGDIVYYDEDQCFYVVDRLKEMLKYKSWHVAPAVIENILLNHPAVKEAVVIGIPDDEDGDHAMAIVILENDAEDPREEEIEEYVNSRVSDREKLRAGVKFVSNFPMTPSGKIKRQELKKMVLAEEL